MFLFLPGLPSEKKDNIIMLKTVHHLFFRPVFDEVSKELGVEDKNPFGEEEEEDEYDSSGKNPFAE